MNSEMKAVKVLEILLPNGGWTIYGDDFDTIIYDEGVSPITKKQFTDTLKIAEQTYITEAEAKAQAKATAEGKLAALGLTTDDLRALGL
jgi:uncharacterized membrane protein YkoI